MEWSNNNRYNSFNSYKGLTYYPFYKQVVNWLDGDDYLPPAIECNLDPMAECNLRCYFCVTQRYLRYKREEVKERRWLTKEYMRRLVDFLADWGTRGLCISGGGEPTLNKDVWGIPLYAVRRGMDVSYVTNAVLLPEELIDNIMACTWVAFSIDAPNAGIYKRVKGKDKFNDVIRHIQILTRRREQVKSKVLLSFKNLILPENQHVLHQACKLAKELGMQEFTARPVDFERNDIAGGKKLDFDMDLIKEQFSLCHKEETDTFKVYTVTHKFDSNLHVKHDFTRCLASPILLPILADGNAYFCVDHKMEADYKLGSCYPDPENLLSWWGSNKHRDMVKGIDINKCSRCTVGEYHKQIEDTVLSDKMCLSFP